MKKLILAIIFASSCNNFFAAASANILQKLPAEPVAEGFFATNLSLLVKHNSDLQKEIVNLQSQITELNTQINPTWLSRAQQIIYNPQFVIPVGLWIIKKIRNGFSNNSKPQIQNVTVENKAKSTETQSTIAQEISN